MLSMPNVLSHSRTAKIVEIQGSINAQNAPELKQHLEDTVSAQETASLMVDMSQVGALD
jgi:anti-anti-sigma regulatory factor